MLFLLACQTPAPIQLGRQHAGKGDDTGTIAQETGARDSSPQDTGSKVTTEPAGFPDTCAAYLAMHPNTKDGTVTLYINGNDKKPWTAYCADMNAKPLEYLTIQEGISQYTAGGGAEGSTVRTSYQRVRIDPATLQLSISDQRFASSKGSLVQGNDAVSAMPLGVAMSCDGQVSGVGSLDVGNTPFLLPQKGWTVDGFKAGGKASFSADQQRVDLVGGGYCGWNGPGVYNPINQAVGVISLSYGK